jgi:hypothetical protein
VGARLKVVKGRETKQEREDREADEAVEEVVRVCLRMSGRGRLEYLASLIDSVARRAR